MEKLEIIEEFIFGKVLTYDDGREGQLLDGAVSAQYHDLVNMNDEEKIDELYNYIINEEDAMNEILLLEKMSDIAGDKTRYNFIKNILEESFDNVIEDDNIFEDEKSEGKTEVLIDDEEVEEIEEEKPSISDLLKSLGDSPVYYEEDVEEDESDEIEDSIEVIEPSRNLEIEVEDEEVEDEEELEENFEEEHDEEELEESNEELEEIEVEPVKQRKRSGIKEFFKKLFRTTEDEKDDFLGEDIDEIEEIELPKKEKVNDDVELDIEVEAIHTKRKKEGFFARLFRKNKKVEEKAETSTENFVDYKEVEEDIVDEVEDVDTIIDTEEEVSEVEEVVVDREFINYIYDNYTEKDILNSIEESKERLASLKEELVDYKLSLYVTDNKSVVMDKIAQLEKEIELEQIRQNSITFKHQLFMEECKSRYEQELEKELEEKALLEETIKNEVKKQKEEADNNYVEFWTNLEDKQMSSLQSYSDDEINELYAKSKEDSLLGKAAKEMIKKSNKEYEKQLVKNLGLTLKAYKEIKKINEEKNLSSVELVDFIRENNDKKLTLGK